uniref:Signal peptidase complex subunit 2 n=1 Tax=Entomoneis paludosa TaxID=265537 RepID=A0A7S2YSC5_9STRA|mmetsp:Transcript_8174/g.17057  ORF Transcript_8174/g.17057 Transcript_8174/m.17057 type:complete len:246 (+) Transcript_8174:138-875(+)|eukprot:CAMPEP_0172441740 /NCGR_PEP_ID=MMETSP1065-20121228/2234_1 /TAXON_ID=265537 /ORGANISM="Amphiprora paludosa, Strain CCMP125" /LENGTH=245 /DNA_ID=CAMNT_0013191241 /DNA_START=80 /DNA_END=817 /DNA_ORIENTATION=+
MAKKKSKQQQPPPVLQGEVEKPSAPTPAEPSEEYEGEEEMELLQVDLGDMVKMKQVLDEGISSALLDHVPEDYNWDNFKLLLMFVSCVFAMTAQFAPIPFPESRPVLGICGSLYFILSGILQFITTFIDKDMIMQTLPLSEDDKTSTKQSPLLFKYGLRVRSNFPRFSEFYTVVLEYRIPSKDPMYSKIEEKSVKAVWSVGKFFDKEGYFDEVGLANEVSKLYKRLEAEDYNGKDDDKTAKKKTE